jgi:hypothetical protein
MALFVTLPFVGFVLGMLYKEFNIITLPNLITQKTESLIPSEDPRIPRDIGIMNVNINWENDNLRFSVTEAYLTPFFFSNGPDLRRVTPDNYVVFKVQVRDRRVSGERRSISCNNYFRFRVNGTDTAPYFDGCYALSPQETQIYYVGLKLDNRLLPIYL